MFDFAWSEIALIGVVGLLFVGPKDMPVAIRTVTNLLKKGRKLAGEFQTHVDEMVREADLGEARDQFRQLRSLNVRGQIMKAMDEDGSLKRTLATSPLTAAGPVMKPYEGPDGRPTPALALDPAVMQGLHGNAASAAAVPGEEEPAASSDPAPSILPPAVAKRLRIERARPLPPRFVPPRTAQDRAAARGWRGTDRHVDAIQRPWQMPRQGALPHAWASPPAFPAELPARIRNHRRSRGARSTPGSPDASTPVPIRLSPSRA